MTSSAVEVISVHVPKCAGNSFARVLARNYPEAIHMDYEDQPLDPQRPFQQDFAGWQEHQRQLKTKSWSTVKVIHGHFWAGKYDSLFPDARKITWVRDPIKRLLSHYYYWKSVPEMPHSLHAYMHQHNLSLLEFAQLSLMQNILHNTFFRDRTPDDFAFIGLQEHFAEDLRWLARFMKWPKHKRVPEQNRTLHKGYDPAALDADTEKKLRALNEADLDLYERALQIRARRIPGPRVWVRLSNALRTLRPG